MKGLVIWAQSDCRSTMALYREIQKIAPFPVAITLWHSSKCQVEDDIRQKVGFSPSEFDDVNALFVGENYEKGIQILDKHPDWNHIFCLYQGSAVYRRLIVEAKKRGCRVGICCESPCNMTFGTKRFLKWLYMRFVLPFKVRRVIKSSDFFINCSGNDYAEAVSIGWPFEKIIPFGYYPPPIIGSNYVSRKSNKPFLILATGILSKHRGADVLVEALRVLKCRGVEYSAIITQEGPLLTDLKAKSREYNLPISFPGRVPISDLIRMYETCSVYIGAGRSEPWGMRLNDALNCGAPLVVSRGMGGVALVNEYGCGYSFANGDANDLAGVLQMLAEDKVIYNSVVEMTLMAKKSIAPETKAIEFLSIIVKFWNDNNYHIQI